MTAAVVYGRPGCMQCKYTVRELDRLGVDHIYVDIDQDVEAAKACAAAKLEHGITALPVVVTAGGVHGGFKPDLLRGLAVTA